MYSESNCSKERMQALNKFHHCRTGFDLGWMLQNQDAAGHGGVTVGKAAKTPPSSAPLQKKRAEEKTAMHVYW
jgi:hypothetical protein